MTSTYKIENADNVTITSGSSYSADTITSTLTLPYNINTNVIYGSSSGTWANGYQGGNTSFQNGNGTTVMSIPNQSNTVVVEKKATLDVQGNIMMNGINLEERIKTIEKVLHIPERDAKMEAKYPSLKKKYDEYIDLLGKYRTFEAIKGDEND